LGVEREKLDWQQLTAQSSFFQAVLPHQVSRPSPPKFVTNTIALVAKHATRHPAAAPNVRGFAAFQIPVRLRQLSYFDASIFI
jgi:hypothetical protein